MIKTFALMLLAILTLSCAALEGLYDNLPAQFIQVNGLLVLAVSITWVVWVAKTGFLRVRKE